MPDPVPLCDIAGQYRALQGELDAAVLRVLHSGQAILGPEVLAFEAEAAAYCRAEHALGCGSGTDARARTSSCRSRGPSATGSLRR